MFKSIFLVSIMFLNSCSSKGKTLSYANKNVHNEESVQAAATVSSELKTAEFNEEKVVSAEVLKIEEQALVSTEKVIDSNKLLNHSLWNDLLQLYVTNAGHVNYKGLKADEAKLDNYLAFLSKNKPSASSSKNETLAYWINAYNAFTIKLILDNYPVKSIKDIKRPWDKKFITIDGELMSLGHIEHEILRKMSEPRIHFAIVCASISCPKLQNTAFEPSTIETQLTTAAKEFLADPSRNNIAQNKIKISKIFSWFTSDFEQNGSLIDFLNKYSEIAISQKAKKSYKDYNWNLNE